MTETKTQFNRIQLSY